MPEGKGEKGAQVDYATEPDEIERQQLQRIKYLQEQKGYRPHEAVYTVRREDNEEQVRRRTAEQASERSDKQQERDGQER